MTINKRNLIWRIDGKEIAPCEKLFWIDGFIYFFKPACSSNYKRFDQSNKCWLLTMGFIMSEIDTWNANGWVTNKEKLIPNRVKCNVKHNWLSVLRQTFLEHKCLPCGTKKKYYVLLLVGSLFKHCNLSVVLGKALQHNKLLVFK